MSDVWELAAGGHLQDADRELAARVAAHAHDAEPHQLRFLLAEWGGASFAESSRHLGAALERGAPIADWIVAALDADELDALAYTDACRFGVLARQEPAGRNRLFDSRVDAFLRRGETDALLEELRSVEFEAASREYPELRTSAQRLACGLVWDRPGVAAGLRERFPPEPGVRDPYPAREAQEDAWSGWECDELGALCRFVATWDVLQEGARVAAARTLAVAARADPLDHLRALDSLARSHRLFTHFVEGTDEAASAARLREYDPQGDQRGRAKIQADLIALDQELDRRGFNTPYVVGCVLFVAAIGMAAAVGFPKTAAAGSAPLIVWFGLGAYYVRRHVYRRFVRDRAAAMIARRGCSPARLFAEIKRIKKRVTDLLDFDKMIRDDDGLDALYRAVRLR